MIHVTRMRWEAFPALWPPLFTLFTLFTLLAGAAGAAGAGAPPVKPKDPDPFKVPPCPWEPTGRNPFEFRSVVVKPPNGNGKNGKNGNGNDHIPPTNTCPRHQNEPIIAKGIEKNIITTY